MPPQTPEPERYSLDQMMERLQGGQDEHPSEGELVTRADGTQAIRVRKRKRRSHQPQREEAKRSQKLQSIRVAALGAGVLLLLLFIGGVFVYTNTPAYRNKVGAAITARTGASKAELKSFRVTPLSANANEVSVVWPDGTSYGKELTLRRISAKVSPFGVLRSGISGSDITATEGTLVLQSLTGSPTRPAPDAPEIRFESAVIGKLGVFFGSQSSPVFKVTDTEASLSRMGQADHQALNLHRGTFGLSGWPAWNLDRIFLELAPDSIKVVSFRASDTVLPRGQMEISGVINTADPSASSSLSVKLSAFQVADLFGPDLAKFINFKLDSREVASSNYLSVVPASPQDAEIAVAFTSALSAGFLQPVTSDGINSIDAKNSLAGFPFLSKLATALDDRKYLSPVFDEATGVIRRKGARIEARDLRFVCRALFTVSGSFTIAEDRSLTGSLEVGLPETVLELARQEKLDAMFGPVRNGLRWCPVRLGGSADFPTDDFAASLSGPARVTEPGGSAAPGAERPPADPGKLFEDLTK